MAKKKNLVVAVAVLGLAAMALASRAIVLADIMQYGWHDYGPIRFPIIGEWLLLGLALLLLVNVTRNRVAVRALSTNPA